MQERLVLARVLDDSEAVASSLIGIGMNAQGLGDSARAVAAYKEGVELARAGGHTWFLAVGIGNLGDLALEQGEYSNARALTEGSLALFRQLGDERKIVERVVELGIIASRQGRSKEAETLLREGLEYAQALVDKELAIWCLEELATLALSKGDAERAARVVGAIETLREETGHAALPEEQRVNERTRGALVAELGEERAAAALAIGREMTFEQAVSYALQT